MTETEQGGAGSGNGGGAYAGRIALWERFDRFGAEPDVAGAGAEAEELGYAAVWIGGAFPGYLFENARAMLDATTRLTVASGILNIRMFPIADTLAEVAALDKAHPDRFLLGLGVSHEEFMRRDGEEYKPPLAAMREYLDGLDAAGIGEDRRVLAALGPRMLALAGERSAGAHPYFTTPAHTAESRAALGEAPFLVPEQKVLLETDPAKARGLAREGMQLYLGLANYANSLKRLGFTDEDLADGGSDRLVDAIVAWGDEETVAARVHEHLAAGADQVAVQVLHADPGATGLPRAEWRRLAPALLG
ncbi:LLM class F420-dependent oxidoreductase [Yinghuangia soli]|uniref:LLM class F420-dependent oxidoreductase n=1 Tax=Yinghuangia soli TaxID=2908204 RepID=A0AA41PZ21_9ACTN|nr:LLM class F420-dependent oxidoreductase [Yinghuangia soli]MCF2527766.1 LLM class F420-dependent oxidoreductase [Yinghuangia soli]